MKRLISYTALAGFMLSLLALTASGGELRGLWVDAWHPGFKTSDETSAMVAKAADCNFNVLFVQVRRRGDVYYNSAIEPKVSDVSPSYDALADVITKAHAAGLQVHAWVPMCEVFHDVRDNLSDPRQPHVAHPGWLTKDKTGNTRFPGDRLYLDPGVAEARTYLIHIVEEIAENYEVDGIHVDKVSYPAQRAGYNDTSVSGFNTALNRAGQPAVDDESWSNWRRSEMTQLVREASQAAKAARPGVKVSAAVFPNVTDAYTDKFQDWRAWLNEGILDFAVAMNFAKDTRSFTQLASECLSLGTSKPVYMGHGGWRLRANAGAEQITSARGLSAGGIVIYNYHYCSQARGGDQSSLMDTLKSGPFSQPATVPN